MTSIPDEYLPPKNHLPEKIYPLPEVRLPHEINLGYLFLLRSVSRLLLNGHRTHPRRFHPLSYKEQ